MNTKTQLTIAAQAIEESIGGQAACLRAVELMLEALAQPEPEVAMMREWKPRRMSAEEMQSENTRLQASLEECSGNCTALKDQVRRMRSELDRPMSSEATVLVHDNARLRAEVQALRGAVPAAVEATADNDAAYGYQDGWNACRKAMLEAAPQPAQGEKQ
jgi:predicted nuclease with TOPRIM domain